MFVWIVLDETAACYGYRTKWANWILYWDVLECQRFGKQHVVPLDSSRGPPFSKKKLWNNEWKTLLLSGLPQTGFCAPHLREVVILWNSTLHWCQLFPSLPLSYCTTVIWTRHLIICEYKWISSDCFIISSNCFLCSCWTGRKGTPMMCFCGKGNLLSLQCSANNHLLYIFPRVLLRLHLWFCNAMIAACHVGHASGKRMIGSFVLTPAMCSSPLKYILHGIIMIWSVRGDGWGMTLD